MHNFLCFGNVNYQSYLHSRFWSQGDEVVKIRYNELLCASVVRVSTHITCDIAKKTFKKLFVNSHRKGILGSFKVVLTNISRTSSFDHFLLYGMLAAVFLLFCMLSKFAHFYNVEQLKK